MHTSLEKTFPACRLEDSAPIPKLRHHRSPNAENPERDPASGKSRQFSSCQCHSSHRSLPYRSTKRATSNLRAPMRFCRKYNEGVPVTVSFRIKPDSVCGRSGSGKRGPRLCSSPALTPDQPEVSQPPSGVANRSTLARCPSEVSKCLPALGDLNRTQRNKTQLTQTRCFTFAIICTRKKRSFL